MARNLEELFREAAELPEKDRATLAALLIESLEGEPDADVERAWAEEIERRLKQLAAGEVETIPWEQVREELFGRPDEKR
jgi:putative addiction module component (TIGR02574 family)